METWPIWQIIKPDQFKKLIDYQWYVYGTKLDILCQPEIEPLSEINHLMKIPTKVKLPVK